MRSPSFQQLANELHGLINRYPTEEAPFQDFFASNPEAFLSPIQVVYDNKWCRLAHLPGGIEPDFILGRCDNVFQLVELEVPDLGQMFKKAYPTGRFAHSKEQIGTYVNIFRSRPAAISAVAELQDLNVCTGLLIAGRATDLAPDARQRLREVKQELAGQNITLYTYDEYVHVLCTMHTNYTNGIKIGSR